MTRISIAVALGITVAVCLQAQNRKWPSARDRGLKGKVHIVKQSCSDIGGRHETKYTYEFSRGGKLTRKTSPNFQLPDCIISFETSLKVTQRNARGEISEVSRLLDGDVVEKERYEYEYDDMGNWIKQTTFLMRTYEMVDGDWKEGEWQAKYLCQREIEYYR